MISVDTVDIKNTNHISREVLEAWLAPYTFMAEKTFETYGSGEINGDSYVILCLDEIECLIATGADEKEAVKNMAKEILIYAEDYCKFFDEWSVTINGKLHLPYVLKALLINDIQKIGELIKCRPGEI
jgi:hypothetical protein